MIAHEIAWQHTKHYDPLLSKESWCEMAAREAIEWADKHPKEGLWDKEKVLEWAYENIVFDDSELIIEDLINAMEEQK